MRTATTAIDPLWQCLCPAWKQGSLVRASRLLSHPPKPLQQCLNTRKAAFHSNTIRRNEAISTSREVAANLPLECNSKQATSGRKTRPSEAQARPQSELDFRPDQESTSALYGKLHREALEGRVLFTREIAEYLVKERREAPNLKIYNALILSNVNHAQGAAWRVHDLLEEMKDEGFQPDNGTCHAVLKVVSVHLDHLLRTDILDYMQKRWYKLSSEGAHDVVAGMLRDGLFEQALQRLDEMTRTGPVDSWLWDMAVYVLCDAGELEEAFRIMRMRFDTGEIRISRNLWYYLLDKGSEARHHDATALVWNSQVNQGYLNPSSGVCLNVLATAARTGDAVMGTEVFTHLSKRGTAFQPIHYELLISTYLSTNPPDLKRAISILTIMPLERLEPTITETRALFQYLRDKPELLKEAFSTLRELHEEERKIPIAVLNLLIECYVDQKNLAEALKIYKLIHTFSPASQGPQKSYANVDTFNLLLKGCRTAEPPDEQQASFLVSELLALRITPTQLTYDRVILVFLEAGKAALRLASELEDRSAAEKESAKGKELLDWSFRHFAEMQSLDWMPRFGTLELLAVELAKLGDGRAWDVLQVAEDHKGYVEGYEKKKEYLRRNVEEAWGRFAGGEDPHEEVESPPYSFDPAATVSA